MRFAAVDAVGRDIQDGMNRSVIVYGADWCHDTSDTRRHLRDNGIDFEYVNIDNDPKAEEAVLEWNDGKRRIPTVVINAADAQMILLNPPSANLDAALRDAGILRDAA